MKFPLFSKRESSRQAQLEAQAHFERAVAESLRVLGNLLTRAAELIEAQRLAREGYEKQEQFLERIEKPPANNPRDT